MCYLLVDYPLQMWKCSISGIYDILLYGNVHNLQAFRAANIPLYNDKHKIFLLLAVLIGRDGVTMGKDFSAQLIWKSACRELGWSVFIESKLV